ncbi:aromatic-ring hydroxylase C-terminal domain-containing protein [Micromonospora sp. NBC_00421]|uniref:aromatic-ring hydroxylase C-terminal domain-containing protein n=1 Tax=Micromonospora sp. NBC_00421 TaxID=2975976 RepID=UPI003FA565C4
MHGWAAPPAGALLVRADGYVAWALGPDGDHHLLAALETWFGDPQCHHPPSAAALLPPDESVGRD